MSQPSQSALPQSQVDAPTPTTMLCAQSFFQPNPDFSTPDQAQAPTLTPTPTPTPAKSSQPTEQDMPKNRLQEFTHKLKLPMPIYETVSEGVQHLPCFRSTVTVDGLSFTSQHTFSTRKAAEKDAAKLALSYLSQKQRGHDSTGEFLYPEHTIFCKSIVNELAVKIDAKSAKYDTKKVEENPPGFVSSLSFNGVFYTGDNAKSKKEAEQLVARAVIQSLSGDTKVGKMLSDIIKSKVKMHESVLNKRINFTTGAPLGIDNARPKHDFKIYGSPEPAAPAKLPIEFIHPRPSLDLNIGTSPKKPRQD